MEQTNYTVSVPHSERSEQHQRSCSSHFVSQGSLLCASTQPNHRLDKSLSCCCTLRRRTRLNDYTNVLNEQLIRDSLILGNQNAHLTSGFYSFYGYLLMPGGDWTIPRKHKQCLVGTCNCIMRRLNTVAINSEYWVMLFLKLASLIEIRPSNYKPWDRAKSWLTVEVPVAWSY